MYKLELKVTKMKGRSMKLRDSSRKKLSVSVYAEDEVFCKPTEYREVIQTILMDELVNAWGRKYPKDIKKKKKKNKQKHMPT